MFANELQRDLTNWTVKNSGHNNRRAYIGLSTIADCERLIYDHYIHGDCPAIQDHLKFRIGIEMEAALIDRLKAMRIYKPGESIELYNGLVQGHTDGVINGSDVLEIKTVPHEQYIPEPGDMPNKTYWQVQAYLYYTRRRWAQVLYLARDTGLTAVHAVRANERMAEKIRVKVGKLVQAVTNLERPACSCGRCK